MATIEADDDFWRSVFSSRFLDKVASNALEELNDDWFCSLSLVDAFGSGNENLPAIQLNAAQGGFL